VWIVTLRVRSLVLWGMTRRQMRRSPTEAPLPFEFDPQGTEEKITALGGIPLVVQAFRSLGVPESVRRRVQVKERQRGYDEATFVESFVILNAAGGECLDDFEPLREDEALAEMIGHELPSTAAARKFLYAFHSDEEIAAAQAQLRLDQKAYIPEETEALHGLGGVNRDLVQELGRRCPDQRIATVDLDATIIESRKREALPVYEGGRGYQPTLAMWAEMNVVLADEFRDGNVPANMEPLRVAKEAFAALPSSVTEFYFRADSACHEAALMEWLQDQEREPGPRGRIGFAISARMSEQLKAAVLKVAEGVWQPCGRETDGEIRECAEVDFVPGARSERKDIQPLRYVAIRIRKRQGELFGDGSNVKHFAVVSNLWDWRADKLIDWHREKAGTIEIVNDVLKNELAGGVLPCGRFGANAAWFRLAVISHNVLTALKRLAMKPEMLTARPKRLRFLFFNTPGKLVHHARKLVLRLRAAAMRLVDWTEILRLLPLPAR